jgi:large subunit ribosomal protein L22
MGARKRNRAEKMKEEKKNKYFAVLKDCPTSPRKMRLVADTIRGVDVNKALDLLRYSSKEASVRLEKLLLSAISNWQAKNENRRLEESQLYVSEVFVDQGKTLKRIQPAPQGRAYRIRKRSNHVTIVLDSMNNINEEKIKENQTK